MESKAITLFKDLNPKSDDFTLKAKVARLWKQHDYRKPNEIFQIGMVLVDEEGTKMQANVMKRWFPKFGRSLQEGVNLYISNPTIAEQKSIFKFGLNPNKINFYYKTEIQKCNDFVGSTHGLLFADFNSILSGNLPEHVAIDVIGDVVAHTPLEIRRNEEGVEKKRMTVQLQNIEGVKLLITLWDSFAQQMSTFVTNHKESGRVIFALQFADIKYYKGSPTVSNWFDTSKMYINSDIPEIHDFRQRLTESDAFSLSSATISQVPTIGYSIHEDFTVKTDFLSIVDAIGCFEIKSVIVMGTVVGLQDNYTWYYIACKKCHCKARKSDGDKEVYECDSAKCKGLTITAVPRFRIPLRVQDSSATTSLTLLGYEAFKILGKTAEELYAKNKEAGTPDAVPHEIEAMFNKKFAFKIEITDYNLKHGSSVFSVSKITNDEIILAELQKKIVEFDCQPTDGPLSGFATQESLPSKESEGSVCGENETPTYATIVSSGSPKKNCKSDYKNKSIVNAVKRKLDDVFDMDDICILSSTKAPKSGGGDKEVKLLIPKLEK